MGGLSIRQVFADRYGGGTMIVITPIKPRKRNPRVLEELRKEAKAAAHEISYLMQEDTRTWEHKPKFKEEVIVSQRRVMIKVYPVGPNAEIYNYVDKGTKKHIIRPRKPGGTLRFKWGGPGSYTPKTMPGRHGSTKSYQRGKIVYRKIVHHPGNKGRYFARYISKHYTPTLRRRYKEAIIRAMEAR